jgi:hypothetical protein
MNIVVIEHVALNVLPAAWRARLPVASNARVTVRIEAIRAALLEGETSGEPRPLDGDGFKERMLSAHG